MARDVRIAIVGDASGFSRAVRSANDDAGKLQGAFSGIKSAAAGLASGFAAAQVVQFGADVVQSASAMNETLSKSNAVFGSQAAAMRKWASGAASSFGQSKQEALAAASSFGNMFSQLGIGDERAASMSKSMTELASDFASFHNADITEVLTAQQAAFRGEYDAVQKFVPTINAAAVEQKALAMGLGKTTKELDAQDKALATQALLMEGAGDAMGDYDRTANSLANRQRALTAKWNDAKAALGQGLLPVVSSVTGFMADNLPGAMNMARVAAARFGEAFKTVTDWLAEHRPVLIGIGVAVTATVVPAFLAWAASAAAAAASMVLAVAPLVALTAAVVYAYQNWGWFRDAVDKVASFVTRTLWPALKAVGAWISGTLIPTIGNIIAKFREWATKAGEIAADIKTRIGDIVTFVKDLPGKITSAASGMWDGIKNAFRSAINWIIRAWNGLEFKIPGFDPPGPGPSFGGFTLGVPNIPSLAQGGLVPGALNQPRMILAHGGEVVTPASARNRGGGGGEIHIHVENRGIVGSQSEMGRWIADAIHAYERSNGKSWRQ